MKQAQRLVRVIVPAPLKEPLVYSVPETLEAHIAPGNRVLIPLQRRTVTGIVLDFASDKPAVDPKPIIELLDDRPIVDRHLLKLAQWIAHYYLSPIGEVLATMLPLNSRRESRQMIRLKRADIFIADALGRGIIDAIEQADGKVSFTTLARRFPGQSIHRMLARLESLGMIELREHLAKPRRHKETPLRQGGAEPGAAQRFDLNAEQASALAAVVARVNAGGFETFLLHGVTGSGKTEVYIRAMEAARDCGRKSLILIPEISLTPQLLDQLNERFPQRVGVLHSGLTSAQRWTQWRQIAWGQVDVAVGARSAVFAPVPDLGLIVVDEEHDSSYKQEEGVRYHGRYVAVVRGKQQNCPVILGSATPALESYENCRQGRYTLLEISRRVADRPLPKVEAIDLRRQFFTASSAARADDRAGSPDADTRLVADDFAKALQENVQGGRQSLIFLNRRGFANFLQCTSCGHVWRCPYCSVTLTLHLKQNRLSCHHCDYRRPKTEICPECKNPTLSPVGSGTERVEQTLQRLLPQARVARMDRDTTGRRGAHEEIIRRWQKGEIDVLIGTQMITKGHDVSGVTLVCALLADLSLNLPDFRAAERTFQLLSQVAGRAGRGNDPGRVIVQTYTPDHYAIHHLLAHDYKTFFGAESEFRRALDYPPFGRLINLRLDGPNAVNVETQAKKLASELRAVESRGVKTGAQVEILGPAPAPIEKLRNRFRWQLLLRSKQSAPLLKLARRARELMPRARGVRLHVDVDPNSML